MRIGPLFKWFGSKWSASRHYPAPAFNTICETHAGSAGYSHNHVEKKVILVETNQNVLELWEWLILEATERLVREIPIGVKEGTDIRTLGLSRGQALLLKHWQRTNNVGDCWTISPWGNKPGQWTANTRARVAEECQAVGHWRAFERYPWWNLHSTTIFIDPPYMYNYQYGSEPTNYALLARRARQSSATNQVIACEAVCPKTGRVPDYLPFRTSHRQVTSRRKAGNSTHSKELLFLRGPTVKAYVLGG